MSDKTPRTPPPTSNKPLSRSYSDLTPSPPPPLSNVTGQYTSANNSSESISPQLLAIISSAVASAMATQSSNPPIPIPTLPEIPVLALNESHKLQFDPKNLPEDHILKDVSNWYAWTRTIEQYLTVIHLWDFAHQRPMEKMSLYLLCRLFGPTVCSQVKHCKTIAEAWNLLKPPVDNLTQETITREFINHKFSSHIPQAFADLETFRCKLKSQFGETIDLDTLCELIFVTNIHPTYHNTRRLLQLDGHHDFTKLRKSLMVDWTLNVKGKTKTNLASTTPTKSLTTPTVSSTSTSPLIPCSIHNFYDAKRCGKCHPCQACLKAGFPRTAHRQGSPSCAFPTIPTTQANLATASPTVPFNPSNVPSPIPPFTPKANLAFSVPSVIDSGTNRHIATNKDLFNLYIPSITPVDCANGETMSSPGSGTITFTTSFGHTAQLNDVLHCPTATSNLLSTSAFDYKGYTSIFHRGHYFLIPHTTLDPLISQLSPQVVLTGSLGSDGLYSLDSSLSSSSSLSSLSPSPISLSTSITTPRSFYDWHTTLGHISASSVTAYLKRHNIKLPPDSNSLDCSSCHQGKSTLTPYLHSSRITYRNGDVIASDIWGPVSTLSLNNDKYFISFIDYFSSHVWVYPLSNLKEVDTLMITFFTQVHTQTGRHPATFHTDQGTPYRTKRLESYFTTTGTTHNFTDVDAHPQNGKCERWNRTALDAIRTLLVDSSLSHSLWSEALQYFTFTYNHTYLNTHGVTPHETWFSQLPLSPLKLYPFGHPCFPHIMPSHQHSKLDPRSKLAIFLGYNPDLSYRILDPETMFVSSSSNIRFTKFASRPLSHSIPSPVTSVSPQLTFSHLSSPSPPEPSLTLSPPSTTPDPILTTPDPILTAPLTAPGFPTLRFKLRPPLNNSRFPPDLFAHSSPLPSLTHPHYHHSTISSDHILTKPRRTLVNYTQSAPLDPPAHFHQIRSRPDASIWYNAATTEYNGLIANRFGRLVSPDTAASANKTPLHVRWIFTRKSDGSAKGRLVVKGNEQADDDCPHTYSPTPSDTSFRLFSQIVASDDLECDHYDISQAFLQADMPYPVYIHQPPGFKNTAHPDWIYLLDKSLYGLREAPLLWHDEISTFLTHDCGFSASPADPCVFSKQVSSTEKILLLVHVDDFAAAATSQSLLDSFYTQLSSKYKSKNLGPLSRFLHYHVLRDRSAKTLSLSQPSFISSLLSDTGMSTCKSRANPGDLLYDLSLSDCSPPDQPHASDLHLSYRALVGSLNHLASHSRPDIAHHVSSLSRFLARPGPRHFLAIKQILQYLQGTKTHGLLFRSVPIIITGFCDASLSSCPDTGRSSGGYVFTAGSAAISWKSSFSPTAIVSSTASEIVSLYSGTTQSVWLRRLALSMLLPDPAPILIHEDNQGAIKFANSGDCFGRLKHIDLKFFSIRDFVRQGFITLGYISSAENPSDIFTKPLVGSRFLQHTLFLGLSRTEHVAL